VEVPEAVRSDSSAELYGSSGVEKAVALARYTDLLHGWCVRLAAPPTRCWVGSACDARDVPLRCSVACQPRGFLSEADPVSPPRRLLDQWQGLEPSQPIVVPAEDCASFPTWYCPVPVTLYRASPVTGGCALRRWLLPDACPLPPPPPLWPQLLGRWERQSQPLAVNKDAAAAFKEFLPYLEGVAEATNDASLDQEVKLLKKLAAVGSGNQE
jgi:Ca-activated chloride channel family protein